MGTFKIAKNGRVCKSHWDIDMLLLACKVHILSIILHTLKQRLCAVFVPQTLGRRFMINMAVFCTSHSQAYFLCSTQLSQACILCSKQHFLYMALSGMHFVLYTSLFAHGTLRHTNCALYNTFCTWGLSGVHFVLYTVSHSQAYFFSVYGNFSTWHSWAYILC